MTRLATAALQRHFWFVSLSVGLALVFSIVFASTVTRAGAITEEPSAAAAEAAPPQDPAPAPPAQTATRDRSFIGETRCANCHEDQGERYTADVHSRLWDPRTPGAANSCESCHGPARAHFEDPEAPGLIRNFTSMPAAEASEVCTTCHTEQNHMRFEGVTHNSSNVSCASCHRMHETPTLTARAARIDQTSAGCASCHADVMARFRLPSHHPVTEGAMSCTGCHDPHSGKRVSLQNEVEKCGTCHQAQRTPKAIAHAPVEEGCSTCHTPHGSPNRRLLIMAQPTLCIQCHSIADNRHALGATPGGTLSGAIVRNCVSCHKAIHGSQMDPHLRF